MPIDDTWTGAGAVTSSVLFDSDKKSIPLDTPAQQKKYEAILFYLPPPSEDPNTRTHYLVGRVATLSKIGSGKVLKIFANSTWDPELLRALERMEFVEGTNDDHLVSDGTISLNAGEWEATQKLDVFRNLNGTDKVMVRILFTRKKDPHNPNPPPQPDDSISAFWCWPD